MKKTLKDKQKSKAEFKSGLNTIKRILKDTKPIFPWLLLSAFISLISVGLAMAAPELVGDLTNKIYDYIADGKALNMNYIVVRCIVLGCVYILSAITSVFTMSLMNNVVSRHFTCRIRIDMSRKIENIPVKKIDMTPNGEIISRMTNDVSVMGGSVHDIFNIVINGIIKLIVITVTIFIANPLMAAAVVIFVPLSIVMSAYLASKSEKHFNESRKTAGKLYSVTEENLTGFDTVKAFNLEAKKQRNYVEISEDYRIKSQKAYNMSGILQPLVALVNNISYIAICIIGGYLVINGDVGVGALVSFVLYTQLFSGPLESISNGMSMMQSTIASARRVYEFLDDEEMEESEPIKEKEKCVGEVVFDNVYFSYVEDKPLIENLDLVVNPGEKVAIVGPTGSGKTTIVNLLMRFYDPTFGRILVDGKEIEKMNRSDVREMFGMVLQDTILFSGTVYDNIAYGKEGATYEEVMEAAKRAHIDFFIDTLPQGYDTLINEESTNISSGQKQLLTIARAYLSDRPILILDEATSNVDTRTEIIIQKTMDELMLGRTAFVIAHRLSTIENADIILVVDNGHIVEKGNHNQLLKLGGLYSKMYESQYMKI